MISLKVATLCDSANVREGLLSVLSAGITLFNRESFPAPLAASLALLFEVTDVSSEGATHQVNVTVENNDGSGKEPIFVAQGTLQFRPTKESIPDVAQSVPLILELKDAGLPEPGNYVVKIVVDGDLRQTLSFGARVINSIPTFADID